MRDVITYTTMETTIETKVLLCEDDEGILEVLVIALRAQGFRPLTANGPEEVEALVLRERPHVVLLDLHLGGVNGEDLVPRIKAASGETRIVLMSGHPKLSEIAAAHDVEHLEKPFDLDTLNSVLAKAARMR